MGQEKKQLSLSTIILITFLLILAFLSLPFGLAYFAFHQRENTPGGTADTPYNEAWTGTAPFVTLGKCSQIPKEYRAGVENASKVLMSRGIIIAPELILAIFHAGEHHRKSLNYDPNTPWPKPPWATSEAGAVGPFQILPKNWNAWSQSLAKRGISVEPGGINDFNQSAIVAGYDLYSLGAKGLNPSRETVLRVAKHYCCGGEQSDNAYIYPNRVYEAYLYFRKCRENNYQNIYLAQATSGGAVRCSDESALLRYYSDGEITDKFQPNAETIMRSKMVKVMLPTKNGAKPVWVHQKLQPIFQAVANALVEVNCSKCIDHLGGAFSWRSVRSAGVTGVPLSLHAYGAAIDIDPRLAPDKQPWNGQHPHPTVVSIFKRYGFKWGGDFTHNIDPMHFQWCK